MVLLAITGHSQQDAEESGRKVKRKEKTATSYDRSSLTLLMLDYPDYKYNKMLKNAFSGLEIGDKFNDHNLMRHSIRVDSVQKHIDMLSQDAMIGKVNPMKKIKKEENITNDYWISQELTNQKFTNDILSKWWSRKPSGEFGYNLINERGFYNADDSEIKTAMATKKGEYTLKRAAERLIQKSYILVFDFHDIKTMKEVYDERDKDSKKPVERKKNGYRGQVTCYLFLVDYNDTVRSDFDTKLWDAPKSEFDNYPFPVKYVTKAAFPKLESTQYNPDTDMGKLITQKSQDELFDELVQKGFNTVVFLLSKKYEDFRVKAPLVSVLPPGAKIGLKEGLIPDQRYYVWQGTGIDEEGNMNFARQGVVRVTNNIIDNRQVATGESDTTIFYQVGGKRLDNYGMFIQQRNDYGIGISAGYGFNSLRLEYNITTFAAKTLAKFKFLKNKQIKLPTSFKMFGEIALWSPKPELDLYKSETKYYYSEYSDYFNEEGVSLEPNAISLKYSRMAFGFSKDFYFLRGNIQVTPLIGLGFESLKFSEDFTFFNTDLESYYDLEEYSADDDYASLFMVNLGLRTPINILHNIQLVPSVMYSLGNYQYESSLNYPSYQPLPELERNKIIWDVMLRVQL
jgi:hypothetical protein